MMKTIEDYLSLPYTLEIIRNGDAWFVSVKELPGCMTEVDLWDEILPAIEEAKQQGILTSGPYSPDTIFLRHQAGEFDAVVAMYHDQALVPLKLMGFGKSVNITLGLPLIRTSVDHGTAFDRAVKFNSDSSSMEAAIQSALRLCKNSIVAGDAN